MRDRFSFIRCAIALVMVSPWFFWACSRQPAKKEPPIFPVTIVNPVQKEIIRYLEYTGNIEALKVVDIRARVAGFLQAIMFTPRQKVKVGDVLFVIDPRQYEAQVKEAAGKLAAQKARSRLAQIELEMAEQLQSKEAISVLQLEKQVAQRDATLAEAELADAQLKKAKLDLEWTQVTSPIDGRVNRNLVDVGNLVGATEKTILTTVVNDESVYVYFNITDLDLLSLLRTHVKDVQEGTPSDKNIPIFLALADEAEYPHEGKLDFVATALDQATGTIQARGIFPNPDGILMAGMFARVRLPVEKRMALLVPEIAVQFDQGGRYVLVVNEENVVQQRRIKASRYTDNFWIVDQGLTTTDRVIVSGIQRARPGSRVVPNITSSEGDSSDSLSSTGSSGK